MTFWFPDSNTGQRRASHFSLPLAQWRRSNKQFCRFRRQFCFPSQICLPQSAVFCKQLSFFIVLKCSPLAAIISSVPRVAPLSLSLTSCPFSSKIRFVDAVRLSFRWCHQILHFPVFLLFYFFFLKFKVVLWHKLAVNSLDFARTSSNNLLQASVALSRTQVHLTPEEGRGREARLHSDAVAQVQARRTPVWALIYPRNLGRLWFSVLSTSIFES